MVIPQKHEDSIEKSVRKINPSCYYDQIWFKLV